MHGGGGRAVVMAVRGEEGGGSHLGQWEEWEPFTGGRFRISLSVFQFSISKTPEDPSLSAPRVLCGAFRLVDADAIVEGSGQTGVSSRSQDLLGSS